MYIQLGYLVTAYFQIMHCSAVTGKFFVCDLMHCRRHVYESTGWGVQPASGAAAASLCFEAGVDVEVVG